VEAGGGNVEGGAEADCVAAVWVELEGGGDDGNDEEVSFSVVVGLVWMSRFSLWCVCIGGRGMGRFRGLYVGLYL